MTRDTEVVIHPSGKLDLVNFIIFAGLLLASFLATNKLPYSFEALSVVGLFGCVFFLWGVICRLFAVYKVNRTQLVGREGVFRKRVVTIPIQRIANYEVLQSVSGRVIGICDILIDTPGESGPELVMQNFDVRESQRFLKLLDEVIDDNAAAARSHSQQQAKAKASAVPAPNA